VVSGAVSDGAGRFSLSLLHPLLQGFRASQGHGLAQEPDGGLARWVFLPQDEPCPSPSGGVVQPEPGTLAIAKMAIGHNHVSSPQIADYVLLVNR
jgi:hypothetical protein